MNKDFTVVQSNCVADMLISSLLTGKIHEVTFIKAGGAYRTMKCRVNRDRLVEARLPGREIASMTESEKDAVVSREVESLKNSDRICVEEVTGESTQLRSFRFTTVTQWEVDGKGYVRSNTSIPMADSSGPQ